MRGRTDADGRVAVGTLKEEVQEAGAEEGSTSALPDLVVVGSGNLGLVYFGVSEDRMTMEAIEQAFPGMLAELVAHEGIGLAMMRTADGHAVAIGASGRHDLTTGEVTGEDPLLPYGPDAGDQLRHEDGIDHVGDIVLISRIDSGTDEVAAFEELIGSHGGLGGWQTRPCLVYPADWAEPDGRLIGAPAVHRQLKRWIAEVQT
jgi:hypothetical protein